MKSANISCTQKHKFTFVAFANYSVYHVDNSEQISYTSDIIAALKYVRF